MTRWTITFIAALAVGNAFADEFDVTPELAKKVAVYNFYEAFGTWGYRGDIVISDPYEIFSYDGSEKWFGFYFNMGGKRLPTWAEMENLEKKKGNVHDFGGGTIRTIYVKARKTLSASAWDGGPGLMPPIRDRRRIERFLTETFGGADIKFIKVFIHRGTPGFIVYEYEVNGERYFVDPLDFYWGKISDLPPVSKEKEDKANIAKWDAIDKYIKTTAIKKGRVDGVRIMEAVNAVRAALYNSGDPEKMIYDYVPNYYRGGQGAPGGDWGCGPISASCLPGSYGGQDYEWYDLEGTKPNDDFWDHYEYGWWILGGKKYPGSCPYTSLYPCIGKYGDPKNISVYGLCNGMDWWLYYHANYETYRLLYCQYGYPWNYVLGWSQLEDHVDAKAPPILGWFPKSGGIGHFVTVVGYYREGDIYRVAYFNHDDELSRHTYSQAKYVDLNVMENTHNFGIIFVENPGWQNIAGISPLNR